MLCFGFGFYRLMVGVGVYLRNWLFENKNKSYDRNSVQSGEIDCLTGIRDLLIYSIIHFDLQFKLHFCFIFLAGYTTLYKVYKLFAFLIWVTVHILEFSISTNYFPSLSHLNILSSNNGIFSCYAVVSPSKPEETGLKREHMLSRSLAIHNLIYRLSCT